MPKAKKGRFAAFEGYASLLVVGIPLLVLLCTAILHWTMQVFLEPNLLLSHSLYRTDARLGILVHDSTHSRELGMVHEVRR